MTAVDWTTDAPGGSATVTAGGMALGVPGWELMRRAAEAGRLESVDEIAAGLINDEGWDE